MVVPVSNPSKKKRNLNIGAAPAKLEDEGGQGRVSSDYQIEGMLKQAKPPAKLKGTNKDNATINKLGGYDDPTGAPKQTLLQKQKQLADRIRAGGARIGTKPEALSKKKTPSSDPTGAPKQTLLQKQDQLANRIRAGGKSKPKAAPPKEPNIAPAPASIAKPKVKAKAKPFIEDEGGQGRVSSDYQIEGMLKQARKPRAKKRADTGQRPDSRTTSTPKVKKADPPAKLAEAPKPASKPAAPKLAPRPKPKPAVRKRADTGQRPDSRGSGKDKDLFDTPAGVTSDGYKFYGKEGTGLGDFSRKFGIKYATQEQYEKDFDTHDGEQMGGRPGKSKMKTQGLNRSKRTGFSGRGTGAALRGF